MEKNRWSLIFIGLCLALAFSVSSVEAENKCDKDNDRYVKARPSSCLDLLIPRNLNFIGIDCDDNNDEVLACEHANPQCAIPNVVVGWKDSGSISELNPEPEDNEVKVDPRLCVPAMIQEQDGSGGSYTCAVSDDPIMFNLASMSLEQIQKQGNDDVCSYFEEDGAFVASSRYGMSWAGPCLEGDPCLIRIGMWSPMTQADGFQIMHGDIELGFTRVTATLLLNEDVCNPLTPVLPLSPEDPPPRPGL